MVITHPAIIDVAVIGVEDVEAGEIPKAFVVCAPGSHRHLGRRSSTRWRASSELQAGSFA